MICTYLVVSFWVRASGNHAALEMNAGHFWLVFSHEQAAELQQIDEYEKGMISCVQEKCYGDLPRST